MKYKTVLCRIKISDLTVYPGKGFDYSYLKYLKGEFIKVLYI